MISLWSIIVACSEEKGGCEIQSWKITSLQWKKRSCLSSFTKLDEISQNKLCTVMRFWYISTSSCNLNEFCNSLVLIETEFNSFFKNNGKYNSNTGIIWMFGFFLNHDLKTLVKDANLYICFESFWIVTLWFSYTAFN